MATRVEYAHGCIRWLFIEAFLPPFFIFLLFWPVGFIIQHPAHWYERVFASGDMIPVSAMILLALACEIEQNRLFHKVHSLGLEAWRYGAMVAGIIFLVLYGFCKTTYLNYSFDNDPKSMVASNLSWIASFSLATIAFAILYSAVAKIWTVCKIP